MRQLLIFLIRLYQYTLSPYISPSCRFTPTCSSYAIESVRRFGIFRGSWLALRRISHCHPWHEGGIDPVPEEKSTEMCADNSQTLGNPDPGKS